MTNYTQLKADLDNGQVKILDGGIGTQIQAMGAPMQPYSWAAGANLTHPYTVRRMHEIYIKAGADVIMTNTYSAARHNYEPMGVGDQAIELNIRAASLAQEARDRVAEKPVYVAGSISTFGAGIGGTLSPTERRARSHRAEMMGVTPSPGIGTGGRGGMRLRSRITDEQAKANLMEQAQVLADSGVDLLIAESTGNINQKVMAVEACAATGIPFWTAFNCHSEDEDGKPLVGYMSDVPFDEGMDRVLSFGGDAFLVFHSPLDATDKALNTVFDKYKGTVGVYPESLRPDYTAPLADPNVQNVHSVEDWVTMAKKWAGQGVQIFGGCCGMNLEYIEPLLGALPKTVSTR